MDELIRRYSRVISNMKSECKNHEELQRYINIANKKLEELKEKKSNELKSKKNSGISDIMLEFYEDFLDGLQEDAVMKEHLDKKKAFFSEKYMSGSQIKNSELEEELENLKKDNQNLNDYKKGAEKNIKENNKEINNYKSKLNEQNATLNQQKNKINELSKTIDVRNMENNRLKDGINKRNDTIVKQEKDIHTLSERINTCESKLDEQKVAINQQRNEINELSQTNNRLQAGISKRNNTIVKQEKDINILKLQKPFMKKNTAIWIITIFSYLLLSIMGLAGLGGWDMIVSVLIANASTLFVMLALLLNVGMGRKSMLAIGETLKMILCMFIFACSDGYYSLFLLMLIYIIAFIVECYICQSKEILIEEKNNSFAISDRKIGIGKTVIGLLVILVLSWIVNYSAMYC